MMIHDLDSMTSLIEFIYNITKEKGVFLLYDKIIYFPGVCCEG